MAKHINQQAFEQAFKKMPLIAILRHLPSHQACAITHELMAAGFTLIEVPLNSENALTSIELIANEFKNQIMLGAGTVISCDDMHHAADAGARFIISPHTDQALIKASKNRELISMPGAMTPTEIYSAIAAGADAIKLFPASHIPPNMVQALSAVLPKDKPLLAVGGIQTDTMADYWHAGVQGFGLGSQLYQADFSINDVRQQADLFISSFHALRQQ